MMSCPTCSHTMTPLGCKVTDKTFYWCPRCGTIKPCQEAEATAPALVGRCREFEGEFDKENIAQFYRNTWNRLGIAESINAPDDRPSSPL